MEESKTKIDFEQVINLFFKKNLTEDTSITNNGAIQVYIYYIYSF